MVSGETARAPGAPAGSLRSRADDRDALGRALQVRAGEVGEAVAADWLRTRPSYGPVEALVAAGVRRDCSRSAELVGLWLTTGETPTTAEQNELAAHGRELVDGTFSMADMTKSYLCWRDVTLAVLDEEATRLTVGPETVGDARAAVRHSCDASLVSMVKEYDAGRRELQDQLAAEHAKLTHLALHDPLTGLPNRTLILERLEHALAASQRRPETLAVLYLDLDGFKQINDCRGHDVGDRVLVEVAGRLRGLVRAGDTVARIGGDEFVILCEDLTDGEQELTAVVERVRAEVAVPLTADRGLSVSVSVGTVLLAPGFDTEQVLRAADAAMYAAKQAEAGSVRTPAVSA